MVFATIKTDYISRFLSMRKARYECAHAKIDMRISKKAQYGLRAMVYLAKNYLAASSRVKRKPIPLKEISKKEKISFDFLEKIISDLEKAKLVKAKKGAQGGYFLNRAPEKITAGEILEVLEDLVPVGCAGCQMARICSSKPLWDDVKDSLDSTLNSTTLADLIKKSS